MNVVQRYWTEYRPMSNLQKPLEYSKTIYEYSWNTQYSKASTQWSYSDTSTSTTGEYSKSMSTHEYSWHFLAWVLFEYSPMSTFTRVEPYFSKKQCVKCLVIMNKMIITFHNYDTISTIFFSDDSSSHSLQNCVFQSTIYMCIHIDNVIFLERGRNLWNTL